MGKLAQVYASALLQYALGKDRLAPIFRQACTYLGMPTSIPEEGFTDEMTSEDLHDFLEYLKTKGHTGQTKEILESFLELARKQVGIMGVEVVTAVPLSKEQLADLHIKLIRRTGKQIQIMPRVDPGLIAGMRIIADGMVMDTSVKHQLLEMKEKIYRGVYFSR